MDWLDAYLDNLADGRNAIYPPDKSTWTPIKPNRQQQSMIQDAVAFDQQQQMRMIQEARADLEAHGMSQEDVQAGIGADPGSPAVQTTTTPAPAFPASISITGSNLYANTGPLFPVAYDSFIDSGVPGNQSVLPPYADFEVGFLVQSNPPAAILPPLRVYANTVANGSGGYDYIYMCYLELNLIGIYPENVAPGRWFIGNGYSFSNDNQGYYGNYGYYTALQSKSTPPSSDIANWTRVVGYGSSGGTISNLTFNY
jgi:hypothetical protein